MGYGLARLRIDVNGVRHSSCPRMGVPGAYDLFRGRWPEMFCCALGGTQARFPYTDIRIRRINV